MRRTGPLGRTTILLLPVLMAGVLGCADSPEPPPPAVPAMVPDTRSPVGIEWVDATIPEGTSIRVTLEKSVGSVRSRRGDVFRMRVVEDVTVGSLVALPAGSIFEGFVGEVTPAASGGDQGGSLRLRFKMVRTPRPTAAIVEVRLSELDAAAAAVIVPVPAERGGVVLEGDEAGTLVAAGVSGQEVKVEEGTSGTLILEGPLSIQVEQ